MTEKAEHTNPHAVRRAVDFWINYEHFKMSFLFDTTRFNFVISSPAYENHADVVGKTGITDEAIEKWAISENLTVAESKAFRKDVDDFLDAPFVFNLKGYFGDVSRETTRRWVLGEMAFYSKKAKAKPESEAA